MGIHRFAVNTGEISPDRFNTVWESYRSDTEQRHTPVALHDEGSADVRLARQMADEMVYVSGAEIKVYTRTDNADYDDVWDEDADPTYWAPVPMKAFFKPEPLQAELQAWGVDTPNKTEVVFSHRQVIEQFGERTLRAGDVLQLPYNAANHSPKNYRILNVTPTGNFRYIWLYLTCQVETLTADITVRVEEDMPEEEQVRSGGVYRESL